MIGLMILISGLRGVWNECTELLDIGIDVESRD